ncbi:MAG: hypothetical protein ACOVN0_15320 [Niveispirillum sp.]|uniref:hypothetical protein n=1 Tax=Niveispirillum sp. TaxID=1917217 RepID=UPI003BA46694
MRTFLGLPGVFPIILLIGFCSFAFPGIVLSGIACLCLPLVWRRTGRILPGVDDIDMEFNLLMMVALPFGIAAFLWGYDHTCGTGWTSALPGWCAQAGRHVSYMGTAKPDIWAGADLAQVLTILDRCLVIFSTPLLCALLSPIRFMAQSVAWVDRRHASAAQENNVIRSFGRGRGKRGYALLQFLLTAGVTVVLAFTLVLCVDDLIAYFHGAAITSRRAGVVNSHPLIFITMFSVVFCVVVVMSFICLRWVAGLIASFFYSNGKA